MPRQITLNQTITEDIITIYEVPATLVRVCVAAVNPDGTMVNGNIYDEYDIAGDDFAELMSAGPTWAPGKPAGTYRNEDLWIFIDRYRSAT
jgi:hypothetical protein